MRLFVADKFCLSALDREVQARTEAPAPGLDGPRVPRPIRAHEARALVKAARAIVGAVAAPDTAAEIAALLGLTPLDVGGRAQVALHSPNDRALVALPRDGGFEWWVV